MKVTGTAPIGVDRGSVESPGACSGSPLARHAPGEASQELPDVPGVMMHHSDVVVE